MLHGQLRRKREALDNLKLVLCPTCIDKINQEIRYIKQQIVEG